MMTLRELHSFPCIVKWSNIELKFNDMSLDRTNDTMTLYSAAKCVSKS